MLESFWSGWVTDTHTDSLHSPMNFTTATKLDLAIAEAQGFIKVTRLPVRRAKKSELIMSRVGGAGSRWSNATGGNGRLKAGQLRPEEIALKSALR